jgi:4-hydroxybenzoyl-CoA thioesterase
VSNVHVLPVRIGWGHCDPAGIVYFPRFFELFHEAMETWFADALGVTYREVIVGRRIGFPTVHTEADFQAPTQFGDRVAIELRVGRVGRSSIELQYRVCGDGGDADVRATGRTVVALMDLDPASPGYRRGMPIPDDLRARIDAFAAAV